MKTETMVTHIHRGIDLQLDTMIRLDSLDAMITILSDGIEGDGDSVPTETTVRNYLFHMGQEMNLIRQNLEKISFEDISDKRPGSGSEGREKESKHDMI